MEKSKQVCASTSYIGISQQQQKKKMENYSQIVMFWISNKN